MKNEKKISNTVFVIILIYTIIGVILPFIFKHVIFENTTFSNLSNNEWAGFLGSYVGGILGGLGTLVSVFITVKESRDMQAENKADTDQKLLDDKEEREKEERKQFADDIAVYVGKYITYISKYYYASEWAKNVNSAYRNANGKLRNIEDKLVSLDKEIDEVNVDSNEFIQLRVKREYLCDIKAIATREYSEILKDIETSSKDGDRLEENECYFILKAKLYNLADADNFLIQMDVLHNNILEHLSQTDINKNWLETNNKLLIHEYYKFKIKYTIKSKNNFPISLII